MRDFVIRSIRDMISDAIGSEDVIVCGISALECLNLFSGYFESDAINVYSLSKGTNPALNYHTVNSFDEIETVSCGSFVCTSANQTFNDLLSDYENADELALLEALSNYYHLHGQTFEGLEISSENMPAFDNIRQSAIEYHCGG